MKKYFKWFTYFKIAKHKGYSKRKADDFAIHADEFINKYKEN